jgi:DNA (cytosine-5)-methyltransferase 1
VSTLDVVAQVLREVAPRALSARGIVDLARDRLPTASRTPETVVSRDLAIDVKRHGTASRFLRVDRGEFVLKEALPTAFYNDNDAYAAQWTRNLIAAGEIAAGDVDERSIRDLQPADVASYRQCHFFSGIGVWSRALRDAGWPDDVNVWSGSCPCQPISQAGRRLGFADERHLWPEWFRLIAACRPAVVLGEQVASKDGLPWLDLVFDDLEGADYAVRSIDIPACSVGAPHKRQRLYWVAYARERGREILGASWLHDRGQPRHDAPGRGAADGGYAGTVPDAAGARPCVPEDVGEDRGDAIARAEEDDRWATGDLEPERGRDDDAPCAVPDAERVVWDEGWGTLSPGRAEVEPDRHGEADGAGCGCVRLGDTRFAGSQRRISWTQGLDGLAGAGGSGDGVADGLGDAGLARGGRDAGEVLGAEGAGEGERVAARDLADESVAPGAAHRPGDRIRLDGDPTWGGSVRGYWAEDVEWIYCRPEPGHQDGRWRPTRAGIEPLAAGTSPDVGRTRAARLRGFGNSIVLPLATSFVGAVIDCLVDAARGSTTETQTVSIEQRVSETKEVA